MTDAIALIRTGQEHAMRYWRTGVGSPAGLRDLDAAAQALDDAYARLEPDDLLRGQAAAMLGWMLAVRHMAHAGSERDRETGIHVLEEAITFPGLPHIQATMARVLLGQLYLSRVNAGLTDGRSAMAAVHGGRPLPGRRDLDRAVECFQWVLDGEPVSAELTGGAEAMLKITTALRTVIGGMGGLGGPGGSGGLNFGGLMEAMTAMQDLQRRASGGGFGPQGPGMPAMGSFLEASRVAVADRLDRPVAVIREEGPATPGTPRQRRPVRVDVAALRRTLPDVADLLGSAEPPANLDELVATATTIVHSGSAEPADHLVLAAAMYLRRQRGDDDGWGDEGWGEDVSDAAAAVASLRAAAVPDLPTASVPALLRLATALDAADAVGGRFEPAAEALRSIGADALLYPALARIDAATATPGPATVVPAGWTMVVGPDPLPPAHGVVSYVASDGVVLDLAGRAAPRVSAAPVFVANPRGDRDAATMEAMTLRRVFYPRSIGLGNTAEHSSGPGTADEVLARLDASLLHIGCGITADGALELADGTTLTPATIAASGGGAGGLAVLPPADAGFVALAEALLAAGLTGAIGWLRAVPAPVATVANLMLHAALVDDRLPPARAVDSVRRWLSDLGRILPPHLAAAGADLTGAADERCWSAFVHWGR